MPLGLRAIKGKGFMPTFLVKASGMAVFYVLNRKALCRRETTTHAAPCSPMQPHAAMLHL